MKSTKVVSTADRDEDRVMADGISASYCSLNRPVQKDGNFPSRGGSVLSMRSTEAEMAFFLFGGSIPPNDYQIWLSSPYMQIKLP